MLNLEALEQIEELLSELRESSAQSVPILVEGADDERTLRRLGVEGRIFRVSGSSKTLLNYLESLASFKQIIILTDFDRAGNKLAKFCVEHLKRVGVEPVVEFREKLKAILRKDVKDIEGIARFLRGKQIALKR
ncbi:MAG: toprim domain-containing protein [Candidatus Hadarchaeaceae archaeon]